MRGVNEGDVEEGRSEKEGTCDSEHMTKRGELRKVRTTCIEGPGTVRK